MQSEGTYKLEFSIWNPVDGWAHSEMTTVQVLEKVGPIDISDFNIISDKNESKPFKFTLTYVGATTCFVVDYGDFTGHEFWGNYETCKQRFNDVKPEMVQTFNLVTKEAISNHTFA